MQPKPIGSALLSLMMGLVSANTPAHGGPAEDARAKAQEKMQGAVAAQQTETIQLVLELRDGSRIVGTPQVTMLPLRTSFAKIEVPFNLVECIEFAEGGTSVKVSYRNGDVLNGVIEAKSMKLKTSFSDMTIVLAAVARLTVQGGAGSRGLPAGLSKGLLIYYDFDKDEGNTVTDKSGQERDGRVFGATWTSEGAIGGAMSFNGDEQYVEMPAADFPAGKEPRTLAAWVYQNKIKNRYYVLGYGGNGSGDEFRISLNEFEPGQYGLETCYGGWHSNKSLTSKKWYHLAVTYDGKRPPKFFLNGAEGATAGTWLGPAIHTAPQNGAVGTRSGCGGGYFLDGKVDEVMIWDRALTSAEIKTLFGRRVGLSK